MVQSLLVLLLTEFLHLIEDLVHSWLEFGVVVLDVVNQLTQAPESVCFYLDKIFVIYFLEVFLLELIDVVYVRVTQVFS